MSSSSASSQILQWLQLAESHLLLDQLKTAEKYLRKASQEDPTHLRVLMGLARLCCKRGQLREAMQKLEYALKVDPRYPPALLLLGQLCLSRHEPARALSLLEKARELEPDDPDILQSLIDAYLLMKHPDKARLWADSLCQRFADRPESWESLRKVAMAQGDILTYAAATNRLTELEPGREAEALSAEEVDRQWTALEQVHAKTSTRNLTQRWAGLSEAELDHQFARIQETYGQDL
jgi:Flp pilus assembly protein TadD